MDFEKFAEKLPRSFWHVVLEENLKNILMERVPNDDILKSVIKKRTLSGNTVDRKTTIVGHMLRNSIWFTTPIEGIIAVSYTHLDVYKRQGYTSYDTDSSYVSYVIHIIILHFES